MVIRILIDIEEYTKDKHSKEAIIWCTMGEYVKELKLEMRAALRNEMNKLEETTMVAAVLIKSTTKEWSQTQKETMSTGIKQLGKATTAITVKIEENA